MERTGRGQVRGPAHLVGVVHCRDASGATRTLSVSRRQCVRCGALCLAIRGLVPDGVELVDAIRPSLDAGVDLEVHGCGGGGGGGGS